MIEDKINKKISEKAARIRRMEKMLEKKLFDLHIHQNKLLDWSLFIFFFEVSFFKKSAIYGFAFDIINLLASFFVQPINEFVRERTVLAVFLLFFLLPVISAIILHTAASFIKTLRFGIYSKKERKKAEEDIIILKTLLVMERTLGDIITSEKLEKDIT